MTLSPFLLLANCGTQESKITGLGQRTEVFYLNPHRGYQCSLENTYVWALPLEIPL